MELLRKLNKIIKVTNVYSSKYLNIFETEYKDKTGKNKKWISASRKNKIEYENFIFEKQQTSADAVLIAAVNTDINAIVVIREFRISINDFIYSLPAGLVDKEENIYETAKREMKEETGLTLYDIDEAKSCKKAFSSVGMTDESISIIYGKAKGEFSVENQESSEIIHPMYLSKEESKKLLLSDENIDVKLWLVLQNFISEN
ncbi:NUDIX hydrolase [Peptostreptococcus faecalis]|uniref:NUDIX hydrolase n=1 Tax=Peptostreptococcus faecalis TaxID=2045015 RepID=UPI000C7D0CB3|nr:NUDIX hydrolase [Peptostreptococcus faecalis]